ncbi:MAG: HAMP domain-containing histidine kinase [Cyclobacteriaceae bacterium]|nr:HAMP domain-containing histidine kinase [Cyclobacteriaceae bacterium]
MEGSDKNDQDQVELNHMINLLEEKNARLLERERDLADKTEELLAQKEELTAAIEEVMAKNLSLSSTMSQLQDRNFELDQILYRTSHDLRTPLSSIKGILHLLKTEVQTDRAKDCCAHIESKTEQMDNLLRSLSSLSKAILEEPEFSVVPLMEIIQEVITSLSNIRASSNLTIEFNLVETGMKTDRALLSIILHSLLSNAFTFRNPGERGTITIHAYKLNKTISIEIIDDGEGISPDIRDKIFQMFYRGSERSQGSGLGLYVARQAAARLHGSIEVSTPSSNTCFTVKLPQID